MFEQVCYVKHLSIIDIHNNIGINVNVRSSCIDDSNGNIAVALVIGMRARRRLVGSFLSRRRSISWEVLGTPLSREPSQK